MDLWKETKNGQEKMDTLNDDYEWGLSMCNDEHFMEDLREAEGQETLNPDEEITSDHIVSRLLRDRRRININ